ncbi:Autoinducer 2-binding periplasmic protein LuxP precursor [Marinomonas spartinae]|uniref:Autoinducer 2-binding periplasmic protein LuxP n=1 Tax=Marinomonas spartinae TaxID=1792290 RepID=A0A1A8T0D9_9GAMM|nr:substrate-binding domain-containing protein [Marinomonas spartinae]SBS24557.1 Autoinducer 2-binding periplasmic protein LuxP precursor [Marinomonas spartinae]
MRRLFCIKLFALLLLGVCSSAQAMNVLPYVMSSQDFYRAWPDQRPLSEQLSAVVNSPADPINMRQVSPVRVSFLLSGKASSIENKSLLLSFKRRMKELGIAYQITIYDHLQSLKVANPFELIKKEKPNYLVATDLNVMQSHVVERVLQQGKIKVIFFNLSTPLKNWKYQPPFMYVGFNQLKTVQTLASYLDRQLPKNTKLAALVLPSGYLNDLRCNGFLDAMASRNRHIGDVQAVANNEEAAYVAARRILRKTPNAFIFSCTQSISNGVVRAIKTYHNSHPHQVKSKAERVSEEGGLPSAQTNSWGLSVHEVDHLINGPVMVSSLFMWDDLAIAVAEGIKGSMEGKAEPMLYVGRTMIMSPEQDSTSLHLMLQQAYRYSAVIW